MQKVGNLNVNVTQKSVELLRWLIRKTSVPGSPVLSLFDGVGSAAVAAVVEQRCVLSVDYCEEMFQAATRRMKDFKKVQDKITDFTIRIGEDRTGNPVSLEEMAKVYEETLGRDYQVSEEKLDELKKKAYNALKPFMDDVDVELLVPLLHSMSAEVLTKLCSYGRKEMMAYVGNLSRKNTIWNINKHLRGEGMDPIAFDVSVFSRAENKTLHAHCVPVEKKFQDTKSEEAKRYKAFLLYGEHREEFDKDE
jgi:hypothetical protein